MKNWKGFGRKWSWPNRCTVLAFPRRDWRQRREIASSPTTRSRCEPRTFVIQVRTVPTTTVAPDRSVLIRCKLGIYVKVFEIRQLVCRRLTPESLGDCSTEYVNTDYCFIGCDTVWFDVWRVFFLYRVIHKSLWDFRTRLRDNQDRHGRKEHINR